ncbi:MAG: OmpH family outer membrane protein [Proteobacteria bacterium]|nr:OmpH family outer membrane protein [Pseudomonadota bacterium]
MKSATRNFVMLILTATLYSAVVIAGKIGYVDMNVLINDSPQILEANRILTEDFEQQNRKIKEQQNNLNTLEKRIQQEGPLMTADELVRLQERARLLERQFRRAKEDLNDAITIRNSQLVDDVQQQLKQVVTEYAEANGFDAILINAILYANDEIDITDEILEKLKKDYSSSQ